jgi:hypothetical protein
MSRLKKISLIFRVGTVRINQQEIQIAGNQNKTAGFKVQNNNPVGTRKTR